MRRKRTRDGLTVNAIAGTHVVMLAFDLAPERRPGCLGFAIAREDHTEGERYWLKGMKTFAETDPGLGPGGQVSSRAYPFQTFQWADYSAKPDHRYGYTVIPLYGSPTRLEEGPAVRVAVATESESGATHSAFFNRGAVASQEYARRFQNRSPAEVGDAAYRWLSRGLLEALERFIARAAGPGFGLFGAIYEFQWPAALAAIRAAADRGARVEVIYDAIPGGTGPHQENAQAVATAGLEPVCRGRTTGKIMHNKFLVLTKDGVPCAVWTGSTNLTENGIFGHSNCGHVIEDSGIAAAYLGLWQELAANPVPAAERAWMAQHNPAPPDPWQAPVTPVFSPRSGLKVLQWYADIAAGARQALFGTFAFGMHQAFKDVYDRNDGVLRFALMEKEGNGAGLAQGRIDVERIRAHPNVVVAVGTNIALNSFDRWLKERDRVNSRVNVRFVHTKYLLVDPLGRQPIVITGSANFSAASTNANNENMVVIRGDTRIADIYLGEFMRLFSHYSYREAVARAGVQGNDGTWQPNFLISDDSWQRSYFAPGGQRFLRRRYFAGR